MDIHVTSSGLYLPGGEKFPCALGRGGIALKKREGDGVTPAGRWPLRYILYRPDRHPAPKSALPVRKIAPDDGWCDDPASEFYNRPVKLPFSQNHELMWRKDGLYDLVVVLGYNDNPPVAGKGSAIFIHVAHENFLPTEGCVALKREDLQTIIRLTGPDDRICVKSDYVATG